MQRRQFIKNICISLSCISIIPYTQAFAKIIEKNIEKIILSKEEWKQKLTIIQYNILRNEETERPFSSKLLNEKNNGTYVCVGCNLPLFLSKHKYDSKTGWPSFYDVIENHIETKKDYSLVYPRVEYHCAKCGGHHGHVFNDGPKPTGLRYCNNGAVLKFIKKEA